MNSSQSTDRTDDSKKQHLRYFSTHEVADIIGISQATLVLWLNNKLIGDPEIKRSASGKRLWTTEDIDSVKKLKVKEFGHP